MSSISRFDVDMHDFEVDLSRSKINSSFGTIYFVKQKSTNKKCMKMQINIKKWEKQFSKTIEIFSQCNHPTLVPFIGYNIDKSKGNIYLEEMENGSLSEYIKKNTEKKNLIFDDTQKLIISYGIARAMEYLHSQNIIHRNLKTENVLLDSNFNPHVFDFCASEYINSEFDTSSTIMQTTVSIMAPEFIDDYIKYNRTKPIDVFSYSITLYELWTGKQPYPDDIRPLKIVENVLNNNRPQFPSDYNINENIKKLIERCWDQNPEKRPTFTEICDILETNELIPKISRERFNSYKQTIRS